MERLMQFVWQHRLGMNADTTTVDGRPVRIIDQGRLNTDAGPDFFNASVKIGDETWVGNVEIHVRASDWYRHHHDTDTAYDSVILHVVQVDDAPVHRKDGSIIPQMVMKCTPDAARRCNMLVQNAPNYLPCENTIRRLPKIYHTDWITALAMERLYSKSDRILELVNNSGGNWEGATYITFARALGFGLNSQPFETLAKSLPLRILNKHRDDLTTLEALMFGQAGLIPVPALVEEPYVTRLRSEYTFMAHKFSLTQPPLAWKMSRTRPQNFPHRRIALLAQMVHEGFYIVGKLEETRNVDEIRDLFDTRLMGFWANHYTFSDLGSCSSKALSLNLLNVLVINVAVPLLHARATARGDFDGMTQCAELLQQLKSEENAVTRLFKNAGIDTPDAFTSQALVELRREYCEKKKCIYCRFGHRMLSAEIAG
jgi:hypothetical protein